MVLFHKVGRKTLKNNLWFGTFTQKDKNLKAGRLLFDHIIIGHLLSPKKLETYSQRKLR